MYITKVFVGIVVCMQGNTKEKTNEGGSTDRTHVLPSALQMIMLYTSFNAPFSEYFH